MGTIYKLNFDNGDFYIGQTSQTVNTRVTQHKATKGKGCPLLAAAWATHELTSYDILEADVPLDKLDELEIFWIRKLKPTLNTLPGGKSNRGLSHPRAKYTAEQIEQVVDLYLNSTLSYAEIALATEVEYGTVHDILKMRSQQWVWENKDKSQIALAEQLRKTTYKFYDADNREYSVTGSINAFEKEHGIAPGTFNRVLKGQKNTKGWSAWPHQLLELTDPQSEKFTLTTPRAKEFLESFEDLSKFQIDNLVNKHKSSGNWQVRVIT